MSCEDEVPCDGWGGVGLAAADVAVAADGLGPGGVEDRGVYLC